MLENEMVMSLKELIGCTLAEGIIVSQEKK